MQLVLISITLNIFNFCNIIFHLYITMIAKISVATNFK